MINSKIHCPDIYAVVLVLSNVFGAVAIVTALEHYFCKHAINSSWSVAYTPQVIAAAGIAIGYNYFAAFYRNSAREMKRLGTCSKLSVSLC